MATEAVNQRQGLHSFNIRRAGEAFVDLFNPTRKQAKERQATIDQQLGKLRDELARPLLAQGTRIDRNTVAVKVIIDDYWTTYVTGELNTVGQAQQLGNITVYNTGVAYYKDRPEAPFTSHEVIPQTGEPQRVFVYDEGETRVQNWSELGDIDIAEMAIRLRRHLYSGGFFPANPEILKEFLASQRAPRELVKGSLDDAYLRSIDVMLDRIDGKKPVESVIFRSPRFGFKP